MDGQEVVARLNARAVSTKKSVLLVAVDVAVPLLLTIRSSVRSRAVLHLEVLALRHQLQVLNRSRPQRLRLARADRLLWIWLSRAWNDWRAAVLVRSYGVCGK